MANYMFSGVTEQAKAAIRQYADARALRHEKRWRGAMYLLGYVVECKLKARLMENHGAWTLDDLEDILSQRFGVPVHLTGKDGHNIARLVEFTEARRRMERNILVAYNQCAKWRVDWRYNPDGGSETECDEFFEAVECFTKYISNSI